MRRSAVKVAYSSRNNGVLAAHPSGAGAFSQGMQKYG
jgi:hypothetical protein